MSELITAARPYARAAFESAKAHDSIAQWSQALAGLTAIISDPTVERLIGNPRYTTQQLADAITQILGDLLGDLLDQRLRNFVRLLVTNLRLKLVPDIAALFEHYHSEDCNVSAVEITSAQALDDSQQAALCQAIEKHTQRKVTASYRVDANLLAGASIRIGDLVIDGSLKLQLGKLAQTLTH